MGTFRMAKINKQLQREISLLLEGRIKKDTVKDVIITGVDCNRDLESARVFFTSLDAAKRPALLAELQSVKGALRSMLSRSMGLRQVPALEFVIDGSSDYGTRIDSILDRLNLPPLTESDASDDGDNFDVDEVNDEDEDGGARSWR